MSKEIGKSSQQQAKYPYPSSWIDNLITWIEGLPISVPSAYGLALVLMAFLSNAILWLEGPLKFPSIDPVETILSVILFYWLALYQYLSHVSRGALQSFHRLLKVDQSELRVLEYQLTTLPRSKGRLAILLGIILQVLTLLNDPSSFGDPQRTLYFAGNIVFLTFVVFTFFALIIRSIQQFRLVRNLHARAANLNLLDLAPAHAFGTLTSKAGIGLILIVIFGYAYEPAANFDTPVDLLLYIGIAMLAVIIFVGPLIGMRARLEEAKHQGLSEVNHLLQIANTRLHRKVSENDITDAGEATSVISALMAEREMLEKTSTWPWDTRTVRGFSSTLLLPIFLLFISQLIERIF